MVAQGYLVIVTLLLCGALVTSTPFSYELNQIECRWDSTNRCDNLSNAKDCQVTAHCIQAVWEQRPVPVDTKPICQICKDMIRQARNKLPYNNAELELLEMFEDSCKQIPMKQIQNECRTRTKESLPELIEVLSTKMSHEQVCTVVGLCNSARIDKMLMQSYEAALNGSLKEDQVDFESQEKSRSTRSLIQPDQFSCSTCNLLSSIWKEKFESAKREDMIEQLLQMCYNVNSESDTCSNMVINYFDDIYELVRQQLQSNNICQVAGICAKDVNEVNEIPLPLRKDDEAYCADCKEIIKLLRDSLLAHTKEAQFKLNLEGYCDFSGRFKNECIGIVDQYAHVLYHLLQNNVNTENICKLIGFCHKKKHLDLNLIESSQEIGHPTEPRGLACEACQLGFREVKKLIDHHVSKDEVKDAMNEACNRSGLLSKICNNFIESQGDNVLKILRSPRIFCTLMSVCSIFEHENIEYPIVYPNDLKQLNNDIEISEDIKDTSEKLQWTTLVSKEQDDQLALEETKSSIQRKLCKKAIKQLQKEVRHQADKGTINNALQHICHKLGSIRKDCEGIILKHADKIVDYITEHMTANEICSSIGACHPHSSQEDLVETNETMPNELSDQLKDLEFISPKKVPLRFVCELFFIQLKTIVITKANREAIMHEVHHICEKLPSLIRKPCHAATNAYITLAFNMISHKTPQDICEHIPADNYETVEKALFNFNLFMEPEQENEDPEMNQDNQFEGLDLLAPKDGPVCIICQLFVTRFERALSTKAKRNNILHIIRSSCNILPQMFSVPCDTIVDNYGAAVLDLISKITPLEVCHFMKLCRYGAANVDADNNKDISQENDKILIETDETLPNEQDQQLKELELVIPEEDQMCIFCKLFVEQIKTLVDTKAKRDQILHQIQLTCDLLPSPLREPCLTTVHNYGSFALNILATMKSQELCHFTPFCNSWAEHDDSVEEVQLQSSKCKVCKEAITTFKRMVHYHENSDAIRMALGQVCHKLKKFSSLCEDIVSQHGDKITELMLKHIPANLICKTIDMCPASATQEIPEVSQDKQLEEFELLDPEVKSFRMICQLVAQRIRRALNTKAKRDRILQIINHKCDSMHATMLRGACHFVVNIYVADLVEGLGKMSPQKVCSFLNLCNENAGENF